MLASSWAINFAYSKDPKLLGISINWLVSGDKNNDLAIDIDEVVNEGVLAGLPPPEGVGTGTPGDPNDPPGAGDCWWIETRMTWESLLSPSLIYPIEGAIVSWDYSKQKTFGINYLKTKETEAQQMDRIISLCGRESCQFTYVHLEVTGEETRRVKWTNSLLTPHQVYWHNALDQMIGGALKGDLRSLWIEDVEIGIPHQARGAGSMFDGLGTFSGLGGF
jgi:hypothetical protein